MSSVTNELTKVVHVKITQLRSYVLRITSQVLHALLTNRILHDVSFWLYLSASCSKLD